MDLIDSHAHLEFPQFDADRDEVLARARNAGVGTILAIGSGSGPERLDAATAMADRYPGIYATIGIHPHEAKLATEEHYAQLGQIVKHPRVIAWGEIGLDYFYDHSPREVQHEVFTRQMRMARAARKPVVIHCRDAWADCIDMLRAEWASSGLGGIFHCFTGTREEAQAGLDMGFVISFAGNSTYPKAQNLRDVARDLPLESIFIETDSPFLAPQGHRGKRNEPALVAEVARVLATVRNLATEEFAAATAENFRRFFRLQQAV